MEPQQARLTFAVFLALSAAIVFNALYLQKDAGFAPARGYAARLPVSARLPGAGHAAGRMAHSKENELLRAIRRELAAHNYFPGPVDGLSDQQGADVRTRAAIMAWQYDNGLVVDGRLSQRLLKSFLFGVATSDATPSGARRFSPETRQLVAEVQGILSARGYYNGRIDGLFARKTSAAIRRFEAHRGLPVTGRISGLLVQELVRVTGVRFRSWQ